MNYYNENDPYAAEWLMNLIEAGHIGYGVVDDRDIRTLDTNVAIAMRRAHFFAGIGGWEYALQLAGWPLDRPVWTGSCPCQPFSDGAAGRRKGVNDERHLWPIWAEHIRVRRPATIFGEQVASKAGREWLYGVRLDLETLGYAVGAADLCAASIGAPHIRQRLYWVADSKNDEWRGDIERRQKEERTAGRRSTKGLEDTGSQRERRSLQRSSQSAGSTSERTSDQSGRSSHSFWTEYELICCADGKARRIEPGLQPLADGIPARVDKLRAYGNAIVPQVAAAFIQAFLEAEHDLITGKGA